MTTAVLEPRTYPFDVEDIEYLRHGDNPLLARVFRPRGQGPFPALVECHGGARGGRAHAVAFCAAKVPAVIVVAPL